MISSYLAIDLGTTGCRSIVFDDKLDPVANEYREYGLSTPCEDYVEQDALLWWELTLETMKEALKKAGPEYEIRGISVSSQGITVVPVDESLDPLYPAISWLDQRAVSQAGQIIQMLGEKEMFALTGKPVTPGYTLPKILWLREYQPEVAARTYKYLMPMDYLIAKLTGKICTDHSMASGTLMYDIKNCEWSSKVLDAFGLSEDLLPELKWSGECAGTVLPEIADAVGIGRNCPVAVGAQDQKCAALGAGLSGKGITVSLGTAAAISRLWNEPAIDPDDRRIGWCGYVKKGTWDMEGVINTAATCLRWVRDTMFPGESYDVINREAQEAMERGSSVMFYPYLSGPSCPDQYPDSTGCFYGISLASKRGDIALSVMRGIAYQLRIIFETMKAYGSADSAILFGGGARSPLWCRIIADITRMNVVVLKSDEAAGAGAAILAGVAAGDFTLETCPKMEVKETYRPGIDAQDADAGYRKYREIEYKLWRSKTV